MKQEIYNTLDRLGIDYTRLEHPSIMTMEEGMTIAQKLGVSPCKNLFFGQQTERVLFCFYFREIKNYQPKVLQSK